MEDNLRYASYEDIDILYRWVNDEEVRKNAFFSHHITYNEHKKWFKRLLQRVDAKQYIFLHEGKAVGQIRVEEKGDIGELDYSICKECRGMGYGKKMLCLLTDRVKSDFPEIKKLQGKVKNENFASQSAFQKTGYKKVYELFEFVLEK